MFPDLMARPFEYLSSSRLSSPTCEDLGIPRDEDPQMRKCTRTVSLTTDRLTEGCSNKRDPFSPLCMIPVPGQLGFGIFETTFIRKRNERERDRVRCVNEGYNKLKQHLPLRNKEKRISKVETLRTAIQYIRHLQKLLDQNGDDKSLVETTDKSHSEVKNNCVLEDSDTDMSDIERKYNPGDSLCSSDEEIF